MREVLTAFALAAVLCLTYSLPLFAQEQAEEAPPEATTAPVFFHDRELFSIGPVSKQTAEQRAENLVRQVERIAGSPLLGTDSLLIEDDEDLGVTLILAEDTVVAAVWEQEAESLGKGRLKIAEERMRIIGEAIEDYRHDYSPKAIAEGIFKAIIATAILLLIFVILGWLRRRGEAALERRLQGRTVAKVVRGEGIVIFIKGITRILSMVLVIWLLILFLNFVLAFFPWTLNFAQRLFDLVIAPLKVFGKALIDEIPNFFALAIIIIITRLILRAVKSVFNEIGRGSIVISGFYPDWAGPTYHVVRIMIIAFAVVAAFPYIPASDSPAFKGISVFLGVLFSLGSTSAVANVIAGLILTYMRPFVIGDRVKVGETVGDVTERRLLSTRIHTTKNEQVAIPNMTILNGHIVNYSELAKGEGLILHTAVTIGYDVPWRTVHELLISAAGDTAEVLKEPPPFVLQTALEDFYIRYELNAATDKPERMPAIYSELHQNIQDRFAEGGVEIMSPHYRADRDGGQSTIPKMLEETDS
jgi:small-conductance mechanosensitive channel